MLLLEAGKIYITKDKEGNISERKSVDEMSYPPKGYECQEDGTYIRTLGDPRWITFTIAAKKVPNNIVKNGGCFACGGSGISSRGGLCTCQGESWKKNKKHLVQAKKPDKNKEIDYGKKLVSLHRSSKMINIDKLRNCIKAGGISLHNGKKTSEIIFNYGTIIIDPDLEGQLPEGMTFVKLCVDLTRRLIKIWIKDPNKRRPDKVITNSIFGNANRL